MHPLAALGLGPDADERAVKRAYAQRLKTTRPDEDPTGFQALNETYRSALAFLRWRAENPDVDWESDDEDDVEGDDVEDGEPVPAGLSPAEFEALIGNPRYSEPLPPGEEAPRAPSQVERGEAPTEPFRLDLRVFLGRLDDRIEKDQDEAALSAWLEGETADWPLMLKPRVAEDVLEHLLTRATALTPEQLDVITHHFGLDDVRTGVDPIGLEELRLEAGKRLRQRQALLMRLFEPGNRAELVAYMGRPERGGYSAVATRLFAYLLTSARAYEWAFALRPVPFLNRSVMGFLRRLDEGRFDAFGPRIDGLALQFWEWAEMRREANRGLRWLLVIVGLIAALAYVTADPAPRSGEPRRPSRTELQRQDRREQEFSERIRRINAMGAAEGVAEYDRMLTELPSPLPAGRARMEEIAALARYNRGVFLSELKRTAEAEAAYEEVDRLFGRSLNRSTQLAVARSLVNLGYSRGERKAYIEMLEAYGTIIERYGDTEHAPFEVQIVRAYLGRSAAHWGLRQPAEAREALDAILARFGDRTEGEIGELVGRARERRKALGD